MTPDVLFFREMVEPTVAEFTADESHLRRGLLACLMVAAMTEHYFKAHPETGGKLCQFKGAIRNQETGGNSAIGLIADVANGTKHVVRKGERIGYTDTRVRNMGAVGTLRSGWPIGDSEEVLVGKDGDWRLSQLIESAMDFWRVKLEMPQEDANPGPVSTRSD